MGCFPQDRLNSSTSSGRRLPVLLENQRPGSLCQQLSLQETWGEPTIASKDNFWCVLSRYKTEIEKPMLLLYYDNIDVYGSKA